MKKNNTKIREISFMKILKFRILAFLHLPLFKIIKSAFSEICFFIKYLHILNDSSRYPFSFHYILFPLSIIDKFVEQYMHQT